MTVFRLPPEISEMLADEPETFPNVQYMRNADTGKIATIVNGIVGVVDFHPQNDRFSFALNAEAPINEQYGDELFFPWFDSLTTGHNWEFIEPNPAEAWLLAFQLNPLPANPPVFYPPPPYGHLPLSGTTGTNDQYFRCEAFPTSYRVDRQNGVVKAGTYAFPELELPFVPTGLSAVGRYALPCYFPAIYRYTLEPQAGAALKCGACVPQFGQAGGGVEVMFVNNTLMQNPIAAPHQLDVL